MANLETMAVCCYYFPPLNSVGGRRWIKFAKYFYQNGIKLVFFVADPNEYPEKSKSAGWEKELNELIEIIPIKSDYPILINSGPDNLIQKLKYRWHLFLLKRKLDGNIYDPSSFWEIQFSKVISSELRKRKINKIIISGAPFSYMYDSLVMKNEIPDLKFIADFRDLWVDSKLGYGEHVLQFQGEKRYRVETQKQKAVLHNFDKIVCVSEDIVSKLIQHSSLDKSKITVIPNGFDPEEGMCNIESVSDRGEVLKCMYMGTVNCGKEYYMRFINALAEISIKNSETFRKLEFYFYGNTNSEFEYSLRKLGFDNIRIMPRKPLAELLSISAEFDYLLYFKLENDLQNSFATKFFDYLRFRKPIVILSPRGAVTDYIQIKKIGYVLDENDVCSSFLSFINDFDALTRSFNSTDNFEEFNLRYISKKYIEILRTL